MLARGKKRATAVVKEPVRDGCSARTIPDFSKWECLFILIRHWWELCLGWGICEHSPGSLVNFTVQQQKDEFITACLGHYRTD